MPTLFGVDIAGILNAELGPNLLPATLHVREPSTRNALDLSAGNTPSPTDYPCRGFTELKASSRWSDGTVRVGGRIVSILGASLPAGIEPKTDHGVTIEGVVYRIVGEVTRDPAGAMFVCTVSSP